MYIMEVRGEVEGWAGVLSLTFLMNSYHTLSIAAVSSNSNLEEEGQ